MDGKGEGMINVKIVDMKLKKSDKQFLLDVKLDTGNSYVYVRDIEIAHMDKNYIIKCVVIIMHKLSCMIEHLLMNGSLGIIQVLLYITDI